MKVVLAGGGSGGHVTPLKAIAKALNTQDKLHISLVVVTDRGFYAQSRSIFVGIDNVVINRIFAGKLRRYHSKTLIWHVYHIPTLFKNLRDIIYILLGFIQSLWILLRQRPDVVFCKGGFVCVPIGYMAYLLRIPIIIHDSDTKPGLTNRLLSRLAHTIATGMPTDFYPYEASKMVYVGMPVEEQFVPLSLKQQARYKQQLGFDTNQPVLLLTGGGNGSERLNYFLSRGAGELLQQGWGIIQLTGKGKSGDVLKIKEKLPKKLQKYWQIEEFAEMIPRLLAADVIVARTSASTLQECANAQKVVIGIASPHLADQKMNSNYFASKNAILVLAENDISDDGKELINMIEHTRLNAKESSLYAKNLNTIFAKPNASTELAEMILGMHSW